MSKKNKPKKQKQANRPEVEKTPIEPSESVESNDSVQEAEPAMEEEVSSSQIEQELEEMKAQLQRLGADYQNYQRRTQTQIQQTKQFAEEALVKQLLAVVDNFRLTLEKGPEAPDVDTLLKGVQIVYDQLMDVLKGVGLEMIDVTPGAEFDPAIHEAMLHEVSEAYPENSIVRGLSYGYMMNDRALVPARVSVAKAPPQETEHVDPEQTEEKDPPK